MDQSQLPSLLKLKWKSCETEPPKKDDYYVVKFDNCKFEWFLSYYLKSENKFLRYGADGVWQAWTDQPWRWAPLPRIEKDITMFDLEIYEKPSVETRQ